MEKHILFSFYERAAFCCGYDINNKYRLWSNGDFEQIEMDRDEETDFVDLIFNDVKVANQVEEILEQYKEDINAMPLELSNSDVCDGGYEEFEFGEKKISGFNMTLQFLKDDPLYKHGKKLNVILNKLKKIPSIRQFLD